MTINKITISKLKTSKLKTSKLKTSKLKINKLTISKLKMDKRREKSKTLRNLRIRRPASAYSKKSSANSNSSIRAKAPLSCLTSSGSSSQRISTPRPRKQRLLRRVAKKVLSIRINEEQNELCFFN